MVSRANGPVGVWGLSGTMQRVLDGHKRLKAQAPTRRRGAAPRTLPGPVAPSFSDAEGWAGAATWSHVFHVGLETCLAQVHLAPPLQRPWSPAPLSSLGPPLCLGQRSLVGSDEGQSDVTGCKGLQRRFLITVT